MTRFQLQSRRMGFMLGAAVLVITAISRGLSVQGASPSAAPAPPTAGVQRRELAVYVDGKPAGSLRVTIATPTPAEMIATCEVDVRVRFLIFNHAYFYRGRETWLNGQLARVEAKSDDGGAKNTVEVNVGGAESQLTVNGEPRRGPAYRWTSSYWQLPPGVGNDQSISVLDVDTGKELKTRLKLLDVGNVQIAGAAIPCTHYRVTGDAALELWFDEQNRLVRQVSIELGHRTELVLTSARQ